MAQPRLKYDPASGEMVPETRQTASGAIETLMSDGSWAITQAAPGPTTWTADTFDQFWNNQDAGGRFDPRAGDIFPIATPEDLVRWGFGNQSPDITKGLTEYMPGGDLAAFQAQTGSLPFQFTDAGAVYDPTARTNPMNYEGTPDWREMVWPGAIMALGTLGLTGMLPGTENVFAGFGNAAAPGAIEGVSTSTIPTGGAVTSALEVPAAAGGAVFDTASGLGMGGSVLGDVSSLGLGDFIGALPAGAGAGAVYNTAGSLMDAAGLGATGGGASVPPGTTQATSAIGRLLNGTATADDWLKIGGTALSTVLGVESANDQTDAFTSLANKYLDLGAPARARLEQSYADPMSFLNGPDVQAITQQGSNAAARALSAQYGNPALQPSAWNELNKINTNNQWNQLYNYRNQLAAQGGLGVGPASSFDMNAAGTTGNAMNVVGAGIGALTNPQKSILDQMRELAGMNTSGLFGTSVQRV